MAPKKRLGEMLIEAGIIDETQLKAALGHQRQWGVRIGQALVDLKLVTEADIVRALAAKYSFDIARLDAVDPRALEQALKLLPREFAVRNNVLPIASDTATITVAMSDPSNLAVVDEVQFRTGKRVKVCIGGDREVADAVNRHYPGEAPVEAIALDLDADDGGGEGVFDPFGGGSKDALEAFFGSGPDAHAHEPAASHAAAVPQPAAIAPAPAAHAPPPLAVALAPAAHATAQPAAHASAAPASHPPAPSASPPAPHAVAAAHAPSASPTRSGLPAQPAPQPPPAAPPRPGPSRGAAAPRTPPPAARPPHATAPPGTNTALHAPGAAPPAARAPAAQRPAPAPPAARGVALDLGEGPRAAPKEPRPPPAAPAAAPAQRVAPPHQAEAPRPAAPEPAPRGEPILATDVGVEEQVEGRASSRELSEQELAILDALERLAGGAHAEPEIVKPTQAMAAVIRLLLRKRIITEPEFLDELSKK